MTRLRFLLFLAALGAACNSSHDGESKNVFTYNAVSGVSSLDPAFASLQTNIWAVNQLFNGLVQVDSALRVLPCIAKSWDLSNDGLTYTFHLRNDVFFHDDPCFPNNVGRKATAHDFVYSFNRLIDPAIASKGAWVFNDKVDSTKPFSAHDDTTFVIKLSKPTPFLPGILTMQYCSVIPREAVERYGKNFRSHPVGTGPFRFSFWRENEALVFLRNEKYFETDAAGQKLPYLDAVRITFLDSKATEFLRFKLGKLDMMSDLDAALKDEVLTKSGALRPAYEGRFQLLKKGYLNTEYLGVNLKLADSLNHPLANPLVRQAMSLSINRQELLTFMRNGIGREGCYGVVAPGIAGFSHDNLLCETYNPAKARALLTQAGFTPTNPLPRIKLMTSTGGESVSLFVANQLRQSGFNIDVEAMQGKSLNEQMVKGNALLFKASWIADYPDAESFLALAYSGYAAPPNYTRTKINTYDRLYEQSYNVSNDSARNVLYQRMDSMLIETRSIVPLYYDEVIDFVQPNVKGFRVNALNLFVLKDVQKS
ncbi:MAG TPA: ABC transporter substrate-binding protein [Chitinophagales bacterium]|nr:ABC transporter substrate-binding protein [Chitinophagales bacterium]